MQQGILRLRRRPGIAVEILRQTCIITIYPMLASVPEHEKENNMSLLNEYRSKLRTAEEAVKVIKNGDWVDYGTNNSFPVALDAALAKRKDELHGVRIRGNLMRGPLAVVECDPEAEHFIYDTGHCSAYERRLCDRGRAFFSPMVFRNMDWYYRSFLNVDVAMITVAPMDEDGNFLLDEDGERIQIARGGIGMADGSVTYFYALTQAQADKLLEVINTTTRVYSYNDSLISLVLEAVQPFFAGQKSAEEVARLTQSRVKLYVNEQR